MNDYLAKCDVEDELSGFRSEFHLPLHGNKPAIYFCGNSLGLLPKRTDSYIQSELQAWGNGGVKGHFMGEKPWVSYHELAKEFLGKLVGGNKNEVLAIGSLTSNLHLLLSSFYQPKGRRVKCIIESGAFPSDFYALHSHMKMKGVDPDLNLIELKPRDGGEYLSTDEIIDQIKECGDELALVVLPGIQYYSGQFFNIPTITKAVHSVGAYVGFDLAHAIGNLPMQLHEDEVDFAVWCTYKYLNSGPGGIGGMFIHEKHAANKKFPRLSGWWGHNSKERFEMANRINPIPNVDGWQLSNANVLSSAAHLASLSIFDEVGIEKLREKSVRMTAWLYKELKALSGIDIITPGNPQERGCQISIFIAQKGKSVFDYLSNEGVICDLREPNVIRIAPVPLYNTYVELGRFIEILSKVLNG